MYLFICTATYTCIAVLLLMPVKLYCYLYLFSCAATYTFLAVLLLIPVYLYCYLRLLNTATMNFFIAKMALQKNILYLIGNNMFESADLTKVKNIPLSANSRVEKF